MMKIFFKKIFRICVYLFAMIGLAFVGMFFAIRFHLTDTEGKIDTLSDRISSSGRNVPKGSVLGLEQKNDTLSLTSIDARLQETNALKNILILNYCSVRELGRASPYTARNILLAEQMAQEPSITRRMIEAGRMQINDTTTFDANVAVCQSDQSAYGALNRDVLLAQFENSQGGAVFAWADGEVWDTIKAGIIKDRDAINRAAEIFGLEPRMLLVGLVGEQVRLFNSQRELVKKFFAPLKILGNANKISLGVMGIKEATAHDIRTHLKDPSSEYYLGTSYENVLNACPTAEKDMYACLTSEEDGHYASYLYASAYLKQILSQWNKAGFDLQYRPEILGTLYNVGFPQSHPKPNPKVGGSTVKVGDKEYTFGRIAYEFYYSGELLNEFPYVVNSEKGEMSN